MKANAQCSKCQCRWYLEPHQHDVTCDRKIGRKVCGGTVVRDEVRDYFKVGAPV